MITKGTRTCKGFFFMLAVATTMSVCPQSSEGTVFNIDAYVDALADDRVMRDAKYGEELYREVERLPDAAKYKLVQAIDRRTRAENSQGPHGSTKTTKIPVDWVWGALSTFPSHVGTTSACGGDKDFRVLYRGFSGAYAHPGKLRLQTNSVYVYSLTSFHGNKLTAYKITDSDDVNVCIGMNFIPKTPVGQSVQGMLWIGLGLHKAP